MSVGLMHDHAWKRVTSEPHHQLSDHITNSPIVSPTSHTTDYMSNIDTPFRFWRYVGHLMSLHQHPKVVINWFRHQHLSPTSMCYGQFLIPQFQNAESQALLHRASQENVRVREALMETKVHKYPQKIFRPKNFGLITNALRLTTVWTLKRTLWHFARWTVLKLQFYERDYVILIIQKTKNSDGLTKNFEKFWNFKHF